MALTQTAVVAGHICLDVLPSLDQVPREQFDKMFLPGRLTQIGPVTLSTGGPVSNTGLSLHKLGIATQLMGKVGDDLFGQAVRQIVAGYDPQLAAGMVVDKSVDTSYTIVLSPDFMDRVFLHHSGANDTFTEDDVRYDLLSGVSLFHFGYPPIMRSMFVDEGAHLAELYRRARATGVTTSMDMAVPDPTSAAGKADWRRILGGTLPNVDVFLPSIDEMLFMVRRKTYDELVAAAPDGDFLPLLTPALLSDLSQELIDMGARVVGLKLGHRGFYVHTADAAMLRDMGRACPGDLAAWADQELWTPCLMANFVGAAGSGDATIAGFLAALLRDLPLAEAVTSAVAVGACNVEAADTLSGVRSWAETQQRLADGWQRHPMLQPGPEWQYDGAHLLWRK